MTEEGGEQNKMEAMIAAMRAEMAEMFKKQLKEVREEMPNPFSGHEENNSGYKRGMWFDKELAPNTIMGGEEKTYDEWRMKMFSFLTTADPRLEKMLKSCASPMQKL